MHLIKRCRTNQFPRMPRFRRQGVLIFLSILSTLSWAADKPSGDKPLTFESLYAAQCSVCHGDDLQGAAQGPALTGGKLKQGDAPDRIAESIAKGVPGTTMPAWSDTLSPDQIQQLALFITERRAQLVYTDLSVDKPATMPQASIHSEAGTFRVELFADGIDPLPFSIAPLADGTFLLTERRRGVRVVSAGGGLSGPIRGTPRTYPEAFVVPRVNLTLGLGWLLDIKPHPDYATNGWIYLHYTERCTDCNALSRAAKRPVSMNKLVRGRIRNGDWVDEEVIWQADIDAYTVVPEIGAGGRLAFDTTGHVYFSVGIKGLGEHVGIQDLSTPYGKIHRVNDDGSIPADNPFVGRKGALPSIWTYGHRSPQGLEYDADTGRLWETEMGQRGGDEVNLLLPGQNYGWPLVSLGMRYTGEPVAFGPELGITFDPMDLTAPVVDLTPAPAVSSFVVYRGGAFPGWQGNLIVGTLKATELHRMVVDDNGSVTHRELLLKGMGRIRDVATGTDGLIYLLLEHASGSRIVRLVPDRR